MLDTVVISGEDVCCSLVFGTVVGVSVFNVVRVVDYICYLIYDMPFSFFPNTDHRGKLIPHATLIVGICIYIFRQ